MIDIKDVINRVKNLQKFEVQMTLPEDFSFGGKVPYDMKIIGDQANVTIYAESMEEATAKVKEYLNA
jgi:hypothetical protein